MLDDKDLLKGKNKNLLDRFQLSISYIPQDFYIKDGSIIENIAYGHNKEDYDFEKLFGQSKLLRCQILLKNLKGLSFLVGERGKKLSGGQKQRLIIARALYKNTKIMILDEATSALDASTERKLIKKLCEIDCTSIFVSHRISSLKNCDRILDIKSIS